MSKKLYAERWEVTKEYAWIIPYLFTILMMLPFAWLIALMSQGSYTPPPFLSKYAVLVLQVERGVDDMIGELQAIEDREVQL